MQYGWTLREDSMLSALEMLDRKYWDLDTGWWYKAWSIRSV